MSHTLVVMLRLGNASEEHGYYRKGPGKNLLEYWSQKSDGAWALLDFVQEIRGEMPLWASVLYQWSVCYTAPGGLLSVLSAAWWSKVGESSVLIYLWTGRLIPQKVNKETVFSVLFVVNMNSDVHVTQMECSLFLLGTRPLSNASSYLPSAQAMAISTKIMHIYYFLIHRLCQPETHSFMLNALDTLGLHFEKSPVVLDLNTWARYINISWIHSVLEHMNK